MNLWMRCMSLELFMCFFLCKMAKFCWMNEHWTQKWRKKLSKKKLKKKISTKNYCFGIPLVRLSPALLCTCVWFSIVSIYTQWHQNHQAQKISLDFSILPLCVCISSHQAEKIKSTKLFFCAHIRGFFAETRNTSMSVPLPRFKNTHTDRQTDAHTQQEKERRRKRVWEIETKRNETHFCQRAFIWQNEHETVPHQFYIY